MLCVVKVSLISPLCEVKVSNKSVDQRIGVSGMATAFRIISRFCLSRIWLEELNQRCPRITGLTLVKEESLDSTVQRPEC